MKCMKKYFTVLFFALIIIYLRVCDVSFRSDKAYRHICLACSAGLSKD